MTKIPMTTIPYDSMKLQRPKKRTRFVLLTDTLAIDTVVDVDENNAYIDDTEVITDDDDITNDVNDENETKNDVKTNRINVTVHYIESYKSALTDDEKDQYWYNGTDFDRFSHEFEQYQQQLLDADKHRHRKLEISGEDDQENNHRLSKPKHAVKNKDWANQVNAILGIDTDRNNETTAKTATTRRKGISPEEDQKKRDLTRVESQDLDSSKSTATPLRRIRRVRLRRSKKLTTEKRRNGKDDASLGFGKKEL